jgi:membrane protease subunit (stomatin/prohibitin family)
MSVLNLLRDQFIDIVEWLDDSSDTLAYRFDRHNNEIKNGAKLIVRPGQHAIFVSEGHIADEFTPGTYTLETKNLPLMTTLENWRHGFASPFKAEVYFFRTTEVTNRKWGTPGPVILRDPELGPVRLRAFGTYTLRIADPRALLQQLISTNREFRADQIQDQLRSYLVGGFAEWLGQGTVSVFDFAARYRDIGETVRDGVRDHIARYGLEVANVLIENIGLPPEVEAALDMRTQMGIVGDLNRYTQFQAANALGNAGGKNGNPAMDVAVGVALGQQIAKGLNGGAESALPPVPGAEWHLVIAGKAEGPFDAATLRQRIAAGDVTRDTLAWKAGMTDWQASGTIADLNGLFAAVPPPVPAATETPTEGSEGSGRTGRAPRR